MNLLLNTKLWQNVATEQTVKTIRKEKKNNLNFKAFALNDSFEPANKIVYSSAKTYTFCCKPC